MALAAAAIPHDKELLGGLLLCALVEADGMGEHLGGAAMPPCLQSATSGLLACALLGCGDVPCTLGTTDILSAAGACVRFLGNAASRHEKWASDLLSLLVQHGVNTEVAYAHNRARLRALQNARDAAHTARGTQTHFSASASAAIAALTTRPVLGGAQVEPPAPARRAVPEPTISPASPAKPPAGDLLVLASAFHSTVAETSQFAAAYTKLGLPYARADAADLVEQKARYLEKVHAIDGTVYMKTKDKRGRTGICLLVHYDKTVDYLDELTDDPVALATCINNCQLYLLPDKKHGKRCAEYRAELYCSCRQSERQYTIAHRIRDCSNAKCKHGVVVRTCRTCRPRNFCPEGHRRSQCPPYCRYRPPAGRAGKVNEEARGAGAAT